MKPLGIITCSTCDLAKVIMDTFDARNIFHEHAECVPLPLVEDRAVELNESLSDAYVE